MKKLTDLIARAVAVLTVYVLVAGAASAAPYAAMVIDARSGEVLHSRNADTRLHPASLTKMMTLYVVFEAVENGEITLDTPVKISRRAAAEPPSKLGLRAGSTIRLRYLIRASAVKSANDAATALAEAIEGSEAAFARRMNRTAKALGMARTTFKNAHGLTESGHLSTARDMTQLGRALFFHYPEYYNLFSRQSTHAGIREVRNTNRRLLSAYRGADGIKTGYTSAAGFNLVASARRGNERVIATVFGGRSSTWRNQRVAELLDMGFKRSPTRVALREPARPDYAGGGAGSFALAVTRSLRPRSRPLAAPAPEILIAMQEDIETAVAEVAALKAAPDPRARPDDIVPQGGTEVVAMAATAATPAPRPKPAVQAVATAAGAAKLEVVARSSTSGERLWAINLGQQPSRYHAEKLLLKTALQELDTLDEALRKVVRRPTGFEANFVGLTRAEAETACARLSARRLGCEISGP